MSTPISFRKPTLNGLIEDDSCDRHWVRFKCLEIYIRKGIHVVREGDWSFVKPCLMVANLSIKPCRHPLSSRRVLPRSQRHGLQLVAFMKDVEKKVIEGGYDGLYVENVYDERQQEMLSNHKYQRLGSGRSDHTRPTVPSFYKSATTILRCSEWVQQGLQAIHKASRASLRAFCQSPSTRRFWIRDHVTGLTLLVKRGWMGASALHQRQRFYILDLHRYKSKEGTEHTLSWSGDRELIRSTLQRVEQVLWRCGFSELAIDPFAMDRYAGERQNADKDFWMYELGYSLDDVKPGFRHKFFVKSTPSDAL